MQYNYFTQNIRPELFVLIPVLYGIGVAVKNIDSIKDKYIPIILGVISMVLCAIYVFAMSSTPSSYQEILELIFDIIIQGVCCAAASVYFNQIKKQSQKVE